MPLVEDESTIFHTASSKDAEVRDRAEGGSESCEAAVFGGTSGRCRSRQDP